MKNDVREFLEKISKDFPQIEIAKTVPLVRITPSMGAGDKTIKSHKNEWELLLVGKDFVFLKNIADDYVWLPYILELETITYIGKITNDDR